MAARTFLLAEALKPATGEAFAELLHRADTTSSSVPTGADALLALAERDPTRAGFYSTLTWTRKQLPLLTLRAWPAMGGLPDSWCQGSIAETAEFVRRQGVPESATRLQQLVSLQQQVDRDELVQWLSNVPLLVVPETLLHQRPLHPTAIWAVDDGSHRAIVLALLDVESVVALVGEP